MLADRYDEATVLRAKAIADGVSCVASELRLMNVADFISFIHLEQFNNIRDIVNSSMELYFKHGTLSYGCFADYELEWNCPPTIRLDLDFQHQDVAVVFNLTLKADNASVEIRSISFADGSRGLDEDTRRLMDAIADARLTSAQ